MFSKEMLGDSYSDDVTLKPFLQDAHVNLSFSSVMTSVIPLNIQKIIHSNIPALTIGWNEKKSRIVLFININNNRER